MSKKIKIHGFIKEINWKSTSVNGNPSYWVFLQDHEGHVRKGYTGSDYRIGDGIRNFQRDEHVTLTCHYTRNGNMIIEDCKKYQEENVNN